MRARSSIAVPFDDTVTVWPLRILRAFASSRESCTSPVGRWNSSSGVRSTAAPEKSGR